LIRDWSPNRSFADTQTRGDASTPLSEAEIQAKYRALATPVLGAARTARLEAAVRALPDGDIGALLDDLLEPPA